jgi:hypothetical protein
LADFSATHCFAAQIEPLKGSLPVSVLRVVDKLQEFGDVTHMLIHKGIRNPEFPLLRKGNRAILILRLSFRD